MAGEVTTELAATSGREKTVASVPARDSARGTETPYMKDAEFESHSVGTNVERYAVLIITSTTILVCAVLGWFLFHG